MLLEKITIEAEKSGRYPYDLSLFKNGVELNLDSPVTVIVGENGTGKSSLLKIIQAKLSLVEIQLPNNESYKWKTDNVIAKYGLGKPKGFFFESVKFINYIEYIENEIAYSKSEMSRIDTEYKNKSDYTKSLAKSPFARTIYELENMYDKDLAKSSHGESYLDFFSSRIKANQIYLLDEPETPLSFQNQLTLVSLIMSALKENCQFIIATHSPVIAAVPNARIYEIEKDAFIEKDYEEIESFGLLSQFLNNREQFLRFL